MKRTAFTSHIKGYAKNIQRNPDNQIKGFVDGYFTALHLLEWELKFEAPSV